MFLSAIFCSAVKTAEAADILNLCPNAGFEKTESADGSESAIGSVPLEWSYFASSTMRTGVGSNPVRSGAQSLRFSAIGTSNAAQGVFVKLPVTEERSYQFAIYVINDSEKPMGRWTQGLIGIEWRDADSKEINRVASRRWDSTLSRRKWEFISIKTAAPAGAAEAHFVIQMVEGPPGGSGSFSVDDVFILEQ